MYQTEYLGACILKSTSKEANTQGQQICLHYIFHCFLRIIMNPFIKFFDNLSFNALDDNKFEYSKLKKVIDE